MNRREAAPRGAENGCLDPSISRIVIALAKDAARIDHEEAIRTAASPALARPVSPSAN